MAKGRRGPELVPTGKKRRQRADSLIKYTDQISFQGPPELREGLTALSYLVGDMGSYAPVARRLLTKALRDHIAELIPDERREFDQILVNVKTGLLLTRKARIDRERASRLAKKAQKIESETELVMDDDDPDSPAYPE